MKKIYFIFLILFFSNVCLCAEIPTQGALSFQIIQQQISFDTQTIKNANIILDENKNFKGLEVELKNPAMLQLAGMTGANIGKTANLVLDKKIISSAVIQTVLNGKILISGIKKEEAELVIAGLNKNKK